MREVVVLEVVADGGNGGRCQVFPTVVVEVVVVVVVGAAPVEAPLPPLPDDHVSTRKMTPDRSRLRIGLDAFRLDMTGG